MENDFKKRNGGITLVALVITIILLLILASISIATLTGSGLFEKARLAEEKSKEKQEEEQGILEDYENKIGEYVDGSRNITMTSQQYEELMGRIEKLEAKTTPKILWTGSVSSGTIKLDNSESIYNYSFLIFDGGAQKAVVPIEKSGMAEIYGGAVLSNSTVANIAMWTFRVYPISEDGNELTIVKAGDMYATSNTASIREVPILKILGVL